MATYGSISEQLNAHLPNAWDNEAKMQWINRVIRANRGLICTQAFQVTASSGEITLNPGYFLDDVTRVLWNRDGKKDVEYVRNDGAAYRWEQSPGQVLSANRMTLAPAPAGGQIYVGFYSQIPEPTAVNFGQTLPIAEDSVPLVLYGVLELMAKSGNIPDIQLANNFHRDYTEEAARLRRIQKKKRPLAGAGYRDWEWR